MGPNRKGPTRCSICRREPVGDDYPHLVCPRCDGLALNDAARPAKPQTDAVRGDNPVYVDGRVCWRHYYPGGWATMLDEDNCRDFEDFCRRNTLHLTSPPRRGA